MRSVGEVILSSYVSREWVLQASRSQLLVFGTDASECLEYEVVHILGAGDVSCLSGPFWLGIETELYTARVRVRSSQPGSKYNIAAHNQLYSSYLPLTHVFITNPAPFTCGSD